MVEHKLLVIGVIVEIVWGHSFRVPILTNDRSRIPLRFSSAMTLLLWCVCGGFLLHILECNYLSVLVKPNYERFIDTSLDIIDMNLTIIWPPRREAILDMLRNSPSSLSRELADRSYVTEVISCRVFYPNSNIYFHGSLMKNMTKWLLPSFLALALLLRLE